MAWVDGLAVQKCAVAGVAVHQYDSIALYGDLCVPPTDSLMVVDYSVVLIIEAGNPPDVHSLVLPELDLFTSSVGLLHFEVELHR